MINSETQFDVIVIGGGASGMMAAGRAAELGKKVLLVEKKPQLGEKLKITGGGRCNITHTENDVHQFLKNYGDAAKFLYSSYSQFNVADTFTFFEKLGLPLVTQEYNRVFPKTERAIDVVKVLNSFLQKGNVAILTNTTVSDIRYENALITGVIANGKKYTADSYIIATGGTSHPETGSTGDGFKWLKDLGHIIIPPTPSIVPVTTKESWSHILSGTTLPLSKITFYLDNQKQFSKTGKILFTHFGLSGPLILNSAKTIGDLMQSGKVTARIDAYPDTDHGALDQLILGVFDTNKNKLLKNVVDEFMPAGMNRSIWSLTPNIDPETQVNRVSKIQRKQLVDLLKALPITITGLLGFEKAVVVDGGVPMTEIDTKTMRSKIIKNLFITGDLLHINRPSGGFSLQLCWTTGHVAGSHS